MEQYQKEQMVGTVPAFSNLLQSLSDVGFPARFVNSYELANLSDHWENPTVDTSKYYQFVLYAIEVTRRIYEREKANGRLCQTHNGRYFVA